MTGMKKGAGEDPFDDDESGNAAESAGATDAEGSTTPEARPDDGSGTAGSDAGRGSTGIERRSGRPAVRIPYKFRRDGVQDGRNRVPLFLHPDTKSAERDALRELEERFDDDVSLTDLREALVKVGLRHLTQVEAQLEEWGYGMTFEE